MPNILTTFLFELTTVTKGNTVIPARETGWSETFVSQALSANDETLPRAANRYSAARMPLLANQGKIIGYRFHDLSNNATRSYPLNGPWRGSGGDCTLPQVALLSRLYAQNGLNNRALELRGLPGANIVTGEYAPGSFSPQALNAFFRFICATYGMLGVDKTQPRFKVKTIEADGTVRLGENQAGIANGDEVQFYRTKADGTCCGSIGKFKVILAAARTLTLEDYVGTGAAHGGKVAKWSKPTYLPFNPEQITGGGDPGWGIERTVIRKSGRPFDLFTGRRSRKCCKC